MQIVKVITVASLLAASLFGPVFGVEVETSKVGQGKLLSEHGLSVLTTEDGYKAAREFKARDTTAALGGSSGTVGGLKKAAKGIFGRHDGHNDVFNVLFGATSVAQAAIIKETCGTVASITTSESPSGAYLYQEATTLKTCPPGSCYNGVASQPTKATYVPGTIELPGSTANSPATTDAPTTPSSTIYRSTAGYSTTTNTILNGTTTFTDGIPTNWGPTAPPSVSRPVTGAASRKTANYVLGAAFGILLL